MQDRVKEASNFESKRGKLLGLNCTNAAYNQLHENHLRESGMLGKDCENELETLRQDVPNKMTSVLKKSSRTRPELTKALGVFSQLKN